MKRLMLCCILLSCGGIKEGRIYDKEHVPSYTIMQYNAATKTMIPIIYPQRWEISIQQDSITNTCTVNENYWDSVRVGDYGFCGRR